MEPSSSTKGFFQPSPVIPPQFYEDAALRRIIAIYLPSPLPVAVEQDLSQFSALVLTKPILAHIADAERHPPHLQPLSTFGEENKRNPLVTSEGWRALQDVGIKEGMVGLGYERSGAWNPRVHQFVKYHIWSASSALVTCPSAMTDGAATLLGRHLKDEHGPLFADARQRLISREVGTAWTSGQWMTERKGGSDVRGTETVARKLDGEERSKSDGLDAVGVKLGDWQIDGFKWFSSATDADMTVLLAKTGQDRISAFYAPLRREVKGQSDGETELNGIRIQRLKNKLGTKPVPTAELELKGMRGYLLGREGEGIKEISTILNITRVHNVVSAVGAWGRGLAISRAYARVRVVGGKLLTDVPAHVRGLAQEHVTYRAQMHLAFLTAALLGISEDKGTSSGNYAGASILPRNPDQVDLLLRLVTPVAKAQTALASIKGLRACMESLGGVGYLENEDPALNIPRLFRDTCVTAIWEGTTDVMAEDVVRVVKGRRGSEALSILDGWVSSALSTAQKGTLSSEAEQLRKVWQTWLQDAKSRDPEELKYYGRKSLQALELVICGSLLIFDATKDQDGVAIEIAKRWVWGDIGRRRGWKADAEWDKKIVFGDEQTSAKL